MTLLAAYNFDEASGAVVDVTGNGHDFTITANITRQTGHTNTGLRHESTAANSGGPTIFGQTAARTLMCWVKRTSNSVDGWIVEMKDSVGDTGLWGFLFTSGNLQARCKNPSSSVFTVQIAQPVANTYYHAAMTFDGAKVHLFINGVEQGTGTTVTGGSLHTGATIFPFFDTVSTETVIDDVRVYDAALDAATITTLMGQPVTGASTTPVSATRATTWRVAAQVTGTRSTTFDVLSVATSVRATTWDVLVGVASTRATTWDALTSITGTRATTWRVVARATGTRATTWDVLTPVTSTRATTWRALAQVTSSRATTWRTRASLTSSRATTWRVRSAVTATRATTWNVASTLTTIVATRSTTWAVGGKVTATRATTWDALTRITTQRDTTWRTRARSTAARSTTWRVRAITTGTRATTWDVTTQVTLARIATWDALASLAATRVTTWRTLARTTATRSTIWSVAAGSSHGPAVQPVLTATNAPSSGLTPRPKSDLVPSNTPSSQLEVSHVV